MSRGRYELGDELARGGSATVYRAFDHERDTEVALKIMEGDPRDEQAVERFLRQALIVEELAGVEGVARVHDHGVLAEGPLAGRPFLAFDFYRETLAASVGSYRGRATAAAKLARSVARTVAAAHARGISHGDLKPANVLIDQVDGEDVPLLADFGAARRTDQSSGSTTVGGEIGTWAYMPREQALELERHDRKRADVYGLGAILYDLLVGHAPYTGTPHDVRREVLSMAPVRSPRARGVEVARDLELIVLCCLEKRPGLRYASAGELVDELTAFIDGRPPRIAELGWTERFLRQCVRHPLGAVLASVAIVMVLAAALVAVWTTGELEATLRDQVTHANTQAARATAGQVLLLLRGFGDALRPCSRDAALAKQLSSHPGKGDARLAGLLESCAPKSTFDSVLALDLDGCPLARAPDPRPFDPSYYERCFDFRDYYLGAKRLAERRLAWQRLLPGPRGVEPDDVYIARAHRSEGDSEFKFSLAMPVFDAPPDKPDAKCVGYLMATLGTDSTIGSYPLSDPRDPGRLGSVVSLRDRERTEALLPLPGEFRVLIHEGLRHGDAVPIASPELTRFAYRIGAEKPDEKQQFRLSKAGDLEASTNFLDPVAHYGGRWLAGFARVGQTDQIVVIQTRYDAITLIEKYLWRVLACTALLLVVGFGAALVAIAALRRRGWL